MSLHFSGYSKAMSEVKQMNEAELLNLLDDLFGRDDLTDDYSFDQLQREALRQLDIEWTDTSSQEYDQAQFWKAVVAQYS